MHMMRRSAFAFMAEPVIVKMRADDQRYGDDEKKGLVRPVELFQYQENESGGKDEYGNQGTVVLDEPVIEGIDPNGKSQPDHAPFEKVVVDDVDPEDRQAAHQDGQEGTMDGTGYRSSNAHGVPV